MPGIITLKNDSNLYENAKKGIYNTVFMKDVIERNKLIDATLLEKVLKFLMNNIENVVFFELLRRGFEVTIGKTNSFEVDFIASNTND